MTGADQQHGERHAMEREMYVIMRVLYPYRLLHHHARDLEPLLISVVRASIDDGPCFNVS